VNSTGMKKTALLLLFSRLPPAAGSKITPNAPDFAIQTAPPAQKKGQTANWPPAPNK
jgi:hypothetical protein